MQMRGWLCLGVSTIAIATAAFACGSDDAAVPDAADGSADGATTLQPDGGVAQSDATNGNDATVLEDGSSTADTSTGPRPADDAGVTSDGGIDPPNPGPGGDTTSITCGTTTCPIPAESCCVMELDKGGDLAFACVVTATCPTQGNNDSASLKCSSAANCAPGTVCCISENNGKATSSCKASCGNGEAQLCDPNAADGGGCAASDECSSDNIDDWGKLPDGYATCGGQGT